MLNFIKLCFFICHHWIVQHLHRLCGCLKFAVWKSNLGSDEEGQKQWWNVRNIFKDWIKIDVREDSLIFAIRDKNKLEKCVKHLGMSEERDF